MVFHAAQHTVQTIKIERVNGRIVRILPNDFISIRATIEQAKTCIKIRRQYALLVFPQQMIDGGRF